LTKKHIRQYGELRKKRNIRTQIRAKTFNNEKNTLTNRIDTFV